MSNYLSDAEAIQLLSEAISINRYLQSATFSSQRIGKTHLREIGIQLQDYTEPINYAAVPIAEIPLKVRRCFVKAVMLLTRYPQLGGKQTGGTYKSPIVSTYQPDPIPDCWYKVDTVAKLCQWFQLSPSYVREIKHLLIQVDRQITRQQQIMQALIAQFKGVSRGLDVLNLFHNLFGNVPLPEASIDCLTTKMQIAFIIDYQKERLKDRIWQNLSTSKQQSIAAFLHQISQFSWQQFARFPSFGFVEASQINSQLIRHLIEVTGYNKAEIVNAIATSITIISKERAESFLLHDIWGHYWQSILTQFKDDYMYLSQIDKDLNLNSSVNTAKGSISLQQLFCLKNDRVYLNKSLAKQFFQSTAKKRIDSLLTHLIGEMLADINEYKWFSENPRSQEMLLSSSCLADFPTKLDLTIQDLDFLYFPLFKTLIELSQSSLKADLIDKFEIEERAILSSLQNAIALLNLIYSTEYLKQQQAEYNKLILNFLKLQNILNRLYTKPNDKNDLPFRDLIIIFVGNYYSPSCDRDIPNLNLVLKKYFFPCWLLLKDFQ